jgi:hypothetical protein
MELGLGLGQIWWGGLEHKQLQSRGNPVFLMLLLVSD